MPTLHNHNTDLSLVFYYDGRKTTHEASRHTRCITEIKGKTAIHSVTARRQLKYFYFRDKNKFNCERKRKIYGCWNETLFSPLSADFSN